MNELEASVQLLVLSGLNSEYNGSDFGSLLESGQVTTLLEIIQKNERDIQQLEDNQQTGAAGYSKLDLTPYQEQSSDIWSVLNGDNSTDNCWGTDDSNLAARFTVGNRISKINRVRILTSPGYVNGEGYEFFLCVGNRCSIECEELEPVAAGQWVESLCGEMSAEYIRITTSADEHLLSFCQFEVYGQELQ
ncbi:uncharacterized protein LOC142356869 isoform X2 [Convolutriloba macropyga]